MSMDEEAVRRLDDLTSEITTLQARLAEVEGVARAMMEMVYRAAEAEDPDEWLPEGLALLATLEAMRLREGMCST